MKKTLHLFEYVIILYDGLNQNFAIFFNPENPFLRKIIIFCEQFVCSICLLELCWQNIHLHLANGLSSQSYPSFSLGVGTCFPSEVKSCEILKSFLSNSPFLVQYSIISVDMQLHLLQQKNFINSISFLFCMKVVLLKKFPEN